MALTEALIDLDGVRHPMAGLVPGAVKMTQRLASLGYRRATALVDTPLLRTGESLRGHEFHYSI
jgi:cobyrinic acid a,c-diamide synthase